MKSFFMFTLILTTLFSKTSTMDLKQDKKSFETIIPSKKFKSTQYMLNQSILNTLEKNYIKKKRILKVCTNPDWAPIEFTKNGEPTGISIDILKIISNKIGLKLKFIKTSSWIESQRFLREKRCDILPSAIKTQIRLKYANFTKPYMEYQLAIITTKDKPLVPNLSSLKYKYMTRKKGSGLIAKIKKEYPAIKIIETDTYAESFKLVSKYKAYFTVATLPVFTYYRNRLNLNNLHVAGETNIAYRLSIAVNKDDKMLLEILQKALKQTIPNVFNIVYEKWTRRKIIIEKDYTMVEYISIIFLILLSIVLFFLARQRKLQKEVLELNKTLEKRVLDAIEKNREKDRAMLQQSRLAQMGEMINMIAHQWRQPLGAISATSSTIHIKARLNKLDNKQVLVLTDKISELSQHLSKTIDDFRNFFKIDKKKKEVSCDELINSTLSIIEMSIKNHHISIITNQNCGEKVKVYDNEVKQVILNIIKNAEDILLERKIKDPKIIITTKDKIIRIEDNAGGIPEDILEKIFDPYFSTKTKKDGTGLGLYMSKTIIEEHCGGRLTAFNSKNGAVFIIDFNTQVK